MQDHVEFLGSRTDVPELLGGMAAFVFSTTEAEGFGIALVEALSAELPVIASDVGPCREVLGNSGAGVLVPPGDPVALGRELHRVLADSAYARGLAQKGVRYAREHYDIRNTTRSYEKLLAAS
jgi:glycosyltransferase involved in cell wall biosynthesis